MQTNDKIISYFKKVVNENNKVVLAKLLSINNEIYNQLIDLLVDYKITLQEIDEWGDYSVEGLTSFIKTVKINLVSYYSADGIVSGDIGKSFLLNNLGLKSLLTTSIEADLKKGSIYNIYDKVLHIYINNENSKDSYKTEAQFLEEFNNKVWVVMKENFKFTTSLHELFPYNDAQIETLFASITDAKIKTFAKKTYESIFRRFFYPRDYLNLYDNGVIYLAYHINDRYSKLENEVVITNNMMNINYTEYKYINSVFNSVANELNALGTLPVMGTDSAFINALINHFDELDFSRNTDYAMNVLFILTKIYESFYNYNNTDNMKVFNILKQQIDLFNKFILNFIEVSNNYILTNE